MLIFTRVKSWTACLLTRSGVSNLVSTANIEAQHDTLSLNLGGKET